MSIKFGKNGYFKIPTSEPGEDEVRKKKGPRSLRPGLFYMFGDRGRYAKEYSESEEIELKDTKPPPRRPKHRRLKSPKSPKTPTSARSFKPRFTVIEEPILPGDTVQRVALRYSCPDSEIRRVNNLYRDQDFFALKTVKIPVRENSALTEAEELERRRHLAKNGLSGNQSSSTGDETRLGGPGTYYRSDEEEYSCDADDEKGDSDGPEYRDISIQSALRWKCSNHTLLEKFDEELQKVREENEQRVSSLKEVAVILESPTIHPVVTPKDSNEKGLLQSLDWRLLVAGFFVVLIIFLAVFSYLYWNHIKKLLVRE